MANYDSPRGFRPYGPILGLHDYITTNASCIGAGNLVVRTPSGTVRNASCAATVTTPNITHVLMGVAAHFVTSAVVGTDRIIKVYDNPKQLFEIQVAENAGYARADFGAKNLLTGFLAGKNAATNRTTGNSKLEIDGNATKYYSKTGGFFQVWGWKKETGYVTNTSFVKVWGRLNPMFHASADYVTSC